MTYMRWISSNYNHQVALEVKIPLSEFITFILFQYYTVPLVWALSHNRDVYAMAGIKNLNKRL
jgi:hypothetical protein